jgi:hypothetical protein
MACSCLDLACLGTLSAVVKRHQRHLQEHRTLDASPATQRYGIFELDLIPNLSNLRVKPEPNNNIVPFWVMLFINFLEAKQRVVDAGLDSVRKTEEAPTCEVILARNLPVQRPRRRQLILQSYTT